MKQSIIAEKEPLRFPTLTPWLGSWSKALPEIITPDMLTFSRFAMAILIVFCAMVFDQSPLWFLLSVLVAALIADLFDGDLARWLRKNNIPEKKFYLTRKIPDILAILEAKRPEKRGSRMRPLMRKFLRYAEILLYGPTFDSVCDFILMTTGYVMLTIYHGFETFPLAIYIGQYVLLYGVVRLGVLSHGDSINRVKEMMATTNWARAKSWGMMLCLLFFILGSMLGSEAMKELSYWLLYAGVSVGMIAIRIYINRFEKQFPGHFRECGGWVLAVSTVIMLVFTQHTPSHKN